MSLSSPGAPNPSRVDSDNSTLFHDGLRGSDLGPEITESIEYRQYQVDAWNALSDTRKEGSDRALLHMATGLGKTTVAAGDVAAFIQEAKKDDLPTPKVLFLANQRLLVHQAADRFAELFPDHKITEVLRKQPIDHGADIVFATLQRMRDGKYEFNNTHFDYIIVDESHHSMAPHYSRTIKYFKPKFRLGITATPFRTDEKDLKELFGETAYSKSLGTALAEGWLTMPDYRMQIDEIIEELMKQQFSSLKALNEAIFVERRNEEIADIIANAEQEIENPHGIIFCRDIEHAEAMGDLVAGSEVLHSRMPRDKQATIVDAFRSGQLKTIITVDMFNEGIDVPDANMLVFLRSTASRIVFEQQLGRGLRKAEGKDRVIVLDFVGNSEKILSMYELAREIKESFRQDRAQKTPRTSPDEIAQQAEEYVAKLGFVFTRQDIDILKKIQEIVELYEIAPDDWVFLGDLYEKLGVVNTTVTHAAESLGIQAAMMMRHTGRVGWHYSPNDAELIMEKITSLPGAAEDWSSPNDIAREMGVDAGIVRTAAKQLAIETRKMRTRAGREGTLYSPDEQVLIREHILKFETPTEGVWRNINMLDQILPISRPTIASLLKTMGIESTMLKGPTGRLTPHYPPDTAEKLLNEFNRILPVPDGWISANAIAKEYGIKAGRVATVIGHTHAEGAIYRPPQGISTRYYSPEEAQKIRVEVEKTLPAPLAPEGYRSTNALSNSSASIESLRAEMAHKGIMGSFMRGPRGKPAIFLSPEEIARLDSD